jgi:type III secretory pathway component EscV
MNFDKLYDDKCVYKIQEKDIPELKKYFQKKQGWVYIAKSKDNSQLKIGRTGKNPLIRAKTLSSAGVLNDYEIFFSLKVFNQFLAETSIHTKLKRFRSKASKEFFLVNEQIAIDAFEATYQEEVKLLSRFLNLEMITEDLDLLEYALKEK